MTHSLYISTTEAGSGKALVSLGIIELILRRTTKVHFFRPLILGGEDAGLGVPDLAGQDEDINLIVNHFKLKQTYEESYGLLSQEANDLLAQHRADEAIDVIISKFKALESRGDFLLCEGSDYLGENSAFEFSFNQEIAKNLGAPILILAHAHQRSVEEVITPVQMAVEAYQGHGCDVVGIIINKADPDHSEALKESLFQHFGLRGWLLSVIPSQSRLSSPRMRDIAAQLQAEVLYGHGQLKNLATNRIVAAMQLQNSLHWLQPDCLVITPGDRGDIIAGMLQAHQSSSYPSLAGLLLSAGLKPDPAIARLIEGIDDPLPILSVKTDTFTTAAQVNEVHSTLLPDDREKINLCIDTFDQAVDLERLEKQISAVRVRGMTPKMFTYNLMERAKANRQHIVLPEAYDPRILKATAILLNRGIVEVTLLGDRHDVQQVLNKHGIALDLDQLTLTHPSQSDKLQDYAQTFYELRKAKGVTLDNALDVMMDVSYFGTMMVYRGDADGMVSGAVHTTQHTIRPALQFVKTKPGFSVVSSVFFMCLEHRVLVYGDCAINPNPTAEQLAEIAISSADTAATFGIEPKVALLSYSSGDSGQGEEVEKVRLATQIARQRRPDLLLEGPIQYDAAVDAEVGSQKMRGSAVAGQATVLIFPDLNTGNNTYKAVQRETGAIAIGPVLQGLKKPVNDLSRGCTVEDIINTVAITAIQAQGQ
ncbi:MAG TPA: phosphate acetyltransferase [Leptolyngbyaceae cyanobacterium M65_K2018_010]|nr:phosphate acetyltransferase [Leptolyngbyaceae cyanobacterium M65_K2018_010]